MTGRTQPGKRRASREARRGAHVPAGEVKLLALLADDEAAILHLDEGVRQVGAAHHRSLLAVGRRGLRQGRAEGRRQTQRAPQARLRGRQADARLKLVAASMSKQRAPVGCSAPRRWRARLQAAARPQRPASWQIQLGASEWALRPRSGTGGKAPFPRSRSDHAWLTNGTSWRGTPLNSSQERARAAVPVAASRATGGVLGARRRRHRGPVHSSWRSARQTSTATSTPEGRGVGASRYS